MYASDSLGPSGYFEYTSGRISRFYAESHVDYGWQAQRHGRRDKKIGFTGSRHCGSKGYIMGIKRRQEPRDK